MIAGVTRPREADSLPGHGTASSRALASVLIAGLVVLLMVGCGPGPTVAEKPVRDVWVLGSWTGKERDAFEAVVAPFEARLGVHVEYSPTRDLEGVLARAIDTDNPPDLAGLAGPAHLAELARSGALVDLDDVLDVGRYRVRVAPTFIADGTIDGRLVGVFVRSAVKGLIWYDPTVFQLGTPTTWDELQRMASEADNGAMAPWCVGLASQASSGWPGTDFVEQFLIRTAGPDTYDAWTAGQLPWDSPQVRRAFELYSQVVAEGAVFGGVKTALRTDFAAAGDPLFDDPPGCLFLHQGSFMPAFFAEHGRKPGVDYDFLPFPHVDETQRIVIGGGDLFGLLTDNPTAAELMRYLVSDEAQSIWVAQGGSLSVDATVVDYPDDISARAARLLGDAEVFRFDGSDLMPPAMTAAFHRAILEVTEKPARLDDVLHDLEVARATAFAD